jgi:hypothetical protein
MGPNRKRVTHFSESEPVQIRMDEKLEQEKPEPEKEEPGKQPKEKVCVDDLATGEFHYLTMAPSTNLSILTMSWRQIFILEFHQQRLKNKENITFALQRLVKIIEKLLIFFC